VRSQKSGESISDFALELQALAERCEFKEFLDTALRDRLIVGLCDSEIKNRLLGEAKNDSFEKVVQTAMSMEMVARSVEAMGRSSDGLNGVRRSVFRSGRLGKRERSDSRESNDSRGQRRRSYRNSGNSLKNRRCYFCHQYGHLTNKCSSRKDKYGEHSRSEKPFIQSGSSICSIGFGVGLR
jgi:hypothetical protein